jgi:hypothetical protein
MNTADTLELIAQLVGLWCIGFAGGSLLTIFKQAMNNAV